MPEYIVTSDVPAFLADKGYKVSPGYFKRIATPGQGKGPQPAGFFLGCSCTRHTPLRAGDLPSGTFIASQATCSIAAWRTISGA
jgi:hypothetical protein